MALRNNLAPIVSGTLRCYDCSGIECNDPFNSSSAKIWNCSNPHPMQSTGFREWTEVEEKVFKVLSFNDINVDDYVCSKFMFNNRYANKNMTMRQCIPRNPDSSGACEFIKKTVSISLGEVFDCSSCDTDLCNSGFNLKPSLITISILIASFLKFV